MMTRRPGLMIMNNRSWINKKHNQTGLSINPNPANNGANKGPLRKVIERTQVGSGGMFGRDKYLLECGHEVRGTKGSMRVRCWKCKKAAESS